MHIVTRLDTDTSGLICIAKNRHIHHLLSEQIQETGFYRNYIAFAEGHIVENEFVIEQPIGGRTAVLSRGSSDKTVNMQELMGKHLDIMSCMDPGLLLFPLSFIQDGRIRSGFICNGLDIRL
ncbi:pseudouridine synthase [Sporosarcina thermotolerans]|uniref:pseudouridine synthase n=1 Tax=Sporosarcina thermotolerans TaxID=633404 RepID=UPI00321AB5C3